MNIYRQIRTCVLFSLIFFVPWVASSAWAQDASSSRDAQEQKKLVDITVRPGGQRMLTPIAVPNVIGDGEADGALSEIGSIMRRCLEMSGYFDVLGPERVFFDASKEGLEPSDIRYGLWAKTGSDALIKSRWERVQGGIALDFRLYDLASESTISVGWEPKTVSESEVRAETYAFINAVIEYYSGDSGIFGQKIAFSAPGRGGDRKIYTIGVDGSQLSGVTGGAGIHLFPTWAGGGALIYTELREHQMSIRKTGQEQPISAREGLNMNGVVSPNGARIAATLSLDGDSDIYMLDQNGQVVQQCTNNGAQDLSATWSPDGSQLAFVSDRSGGPQIFVMNADCSNQHRITFRGDYNTSPAWSPKGDAIAFTGRVDGRYDIFTVNPKSEYIERITQDQGSNMEPTWSPDGRYLGFVSTRGGRGASLFISTADGQIQTRVSDRLSGVDTPAWQR